MNLELGLSKIQFHIFASTEILRPTWQGLNNFRKWRMGKQQIFIPVGLTDISRGSRSDSDEHPRLEIQNIRTPEGVQERSASSRTSATSATHSGGECNLGRHTPGGRRYRDSTRG